MRRVLKAATLATCWAVGAVPAWANVEQERQAILGMAGCFVVDYSFVEVEELREGYVRDPRVYDANVGQTVQELIFPIEKSPTEIRLQHVLFVRSPEGELRTILKHVAQDWEYEPGQFFSFERPGTWQRRMVEDATGQWNRKVVGLDDGPRHQCVANWNLDTHFPSWSCENFAPIPGRESRDMQRSDYNTLQRRTRLIPYEQSWLERQNNDKVVLNESGRDPFVREVGKSWYVRQPDEACQQASLWAKERQPFWEVLMDEWETVYSSRDRIVEIQPEGSLPRLAQIAVIEREYLEAADSDPQALETARAAVVRVLETYLEQ